MKRSVSTSTLARLSFGIPPERRGEFEAVYEKKLAPILKKHGLVEYAERGRKTAEGIFSRLFEVAGPAVVAAKERTLQEDPEFKQVLQGLGASFGTVGQVGGTQYGFKIHRALAGPGKAVSVGPGKKVAAGPGKGNWRTFDATDGLVDVSVASIFQDREGYLWFGTQGGLSRYDGQTWTSFTTRDGLAHDWVISICQDREGYLWFGTWGGGVSRYDGREFKTFTTQEGLAGNNVSSILQDREGYRWFGWMDMRRSGGTPTAGGWSTRICRWASTPSRCGPWIGIRITRSRRVYISR